MKIITTDAEGAAMVGGFVFSFVFYYNLQFVLAILD